MTHPTRRGASTGAAIGTLAVVGTLATAAVVMRPFAIRAESPPLPEPLVARAPAHRQVTELLAMLIGRSRGVIAIHPRDDRPYTEMLLWLEDGANRGAADLDEVAVLAHSAVLQTITLFLPPAKPLDIDEQPLVRWSDMTEPEFCAWWRDRSDVTPRRLATGIESMVIEPVGPGAAEGLLWMRLTWAAHSVDGPDEASVLLDVGTNGRGNGEE